MDGCNWSAGAVVKCSLCQDQPGSLKWGVGRLTSKKKEKKWLTYNSSPYKNINIRCNCNVIDISTPGVYKMPPGVILFEPTSVRIHGAS